MQKSTAVAFTSYSILFKFRRIEFYSWQQETFASFHGMIVGLAVVPRVCRRAQE